MEQAYHFNFAVDVWVVAEDEEDARRQLSSKSNWDDWNITEGDPPYLVEVEDA